LEEEDDDEKEEEDGESGGDSIAGERSVRAARGIAEGWYNAGRGV